MNYPDSLHYLDSLGHELRGVLFRLETIEAILARLGAPHRKYGTAIVAGTNGKGSTAAFLASIVQQAGYRTGLYTSPHLVRVNERIRVNGQDISDAECSRAITEVRDAVEHLRENGILETPPSFFEFLTATAFVHFARASAEFVVLEVGMGGRLDATNVTEPRVAVITPLDLDHQEYLGATLAEIAGEKAGVIRRGRPVVSAVVQPEGAEVIRRRCAELNAPLFEVPCRSELRPLRTRAGCYHFDFVLDGELFQGLFSPLPGRFQMSNASTALAAAWLLQREGLSRMTHDVIRDGLQRTTWPGRLETVSESPLLLLDGAHNPAGAAEIARFVGEHLAGRRMRLVYGSMRDKAVGEMTQILWPLADEVYLTAPEHARTLTPEDILELARFQPPSLVIEPLTARAVARAVAASAPEDVVLVAGSLFLVGEIKRAILNHTLQIGAETGREIVVRT
jgi:dihydrofolate synthase/folylpolyglutamate synthase